MRRLLRRLALYAFHLGFVRPVLNWVVGVRYRRRHLLPDGPCLVVSNHNSHLDAAVLMSMFSLRRLPHVHPVAAADYFGKSLFMRTLAMLFMNGIPIERRPTPGQDPLAPVVEQLRGGETLVFFPEGSRGEAGVVARFRPGVGLLVRQTPGLLVVPVFLSGPERIWPRGPVVPVPLNIDVSIGKPRTYPRGLEARLIADQVRDDVLALAPPPPPVPGPPPAPPLRVAICGIDAAARHAAFQATTQRLGRLGRTLGLSRTVLQADGAHVEEANAPIPVGLGRARLRLLAGLFRTGGRFKGDRFVEMVERAQTDEALDHGRDTRFVVVDGSALVDLLATAEADFYRGVFDESGLNHLMQYLEGTKKIPPGRWWRYIRSAREAWLVNVFALARPPAPDVLVLLSADPAAVVTRLRASGGSVRPHQSESFLARLQEAYGRVGDVLRKRRRIEPLELDGTALDAEAIAERVAEACRHRIEASPEAVSES